MFAALEMTFSNTCSNSNSHEKFSFTEQVISWKILIDRIPALLSNSLEI